LNPVVEEIIGYPVDILVDSSATLFNALRKTFTFIVKTSTEDPIVLFGSVDFTDEANSVSPTHHTQALDGVLKFVGVFFSKANIGPLEHLAFLSEVR